MDIKIIILFVALINFLMGVLVYRKSYKRRADITFAILSFFIGFWAVGLYFYEHPLYFSSLIWIKIVYSIVIGLIGILFYFSFIFPSREGKKITSLGVILYIFATIPLFWSLFFSDLWVKEVIHQPWGYETKLGSAYIFFGIFCLVFCSWLLLNLIRSYQKAIGVDKLRLRYLFIGTFFTALFVIFLDVIIPLFTEKSSYFWLSPVFSLFFVGFIAYAITRHRLMDIRLILKRTTVYASSIITVLLIGILLSLLEVRYFKEIIPMGIWGPVILLIGIIIFDPLKKVFQNFANKYFFTSLYNYQETLEKFAQRVSATIYLSEIVEVIVDTIQNALHVDKIAVLIKNGDYQPVKVIGFNKQDLKQTACDPSCKKLLTKIDHPLVYEELLEHSKERSQDIKLIEHVQERMKELEISIVLPLIAKNKLIACVILGRKISGDAYTKGDLRLLEALANQASISIENARLYSEVQDFNVNLKIKIDEATKRLRELLKIKSEFLTIASHQLRTPTSIVRGMLSLVQKEEGLPEDEREKFIKQAYAGINRLERIIHDLLNATELEGKKMHLEMQKTAIEDVVKDSIKALKPLAQKKRIALKFKKPAKSFPKVMVDPMRLKEAITNLIDNAIQYTPKGHVLVRLEKRLPNVRIIIEDTGIGLSKADKETLFRKFSRGEGILQIHPNGTGLGLFIARKMAEAMGGRIEAESAGKGKGSKFIIVLPVK